MHLEIVATLVGLTKTSFGDVIIYSKTRQILHKSACQIDMQRIAMAIKRLPFHPRQSKLTCYPLSMFFKQAIIALPIGLSNHSKSRY